MLKRCAWPRTDLAIAYHDREWGVPLHDDRGLFEFLILEGAQAGLSWETVLQKRDNYREAFDNFDPAKVAEYNPRKVERLLDNAGIIRNRLKIASAIQNAKAFIAVEVWWAGFIAHPYRLIAYVLTTFILLLGYNRYSGLRLDSSMTEVAIDSVEEMGGVARASARPGTKD
jgi:DNA-3-methyladenine glycosylase I